MAIGNRSRAGLGSLALVLYSALPSGARASSDDAWTSFRTKRCDGVHRAGRKRCTRIRSWWSDPFGSDSYGIALVYARTPVSERRTAR